MSKATKQHYFANLHFPEKDINKNLMKITLQNVHYSVANSIRRAIMSMVSTVGFRALPYDKATINIEKNDSDLNNEIIKHRVSMIPVFVDDDFDLDDHEFIIDETNNSNIIKMVDSSNFKIRKISTNTFLSDKEVKQILPPDELTGDYIPIVKLKPKYYTDLGTAELSEVPKSITIPNIEPISLKLNAKLVRSTSMENGHFSPVCTCSYGYTIDEDLAAEKAKEYIKETNSKNASLGLSAEDPEKLRRRFNINEKFKHFVMDDYGEPNSFDFTIESIGQYTPIELIHRGTLALIMDLEKFANNLKTRNTEFLKITSSANISNGFEIVAEEMNDTLGNIIHCYIVNTCCLYDLGENRTLNSITYNKIHQLSDRILFTVRCLKLNMDETMDQIIIPGIEGLINHLRNIDDDLKSVYV